jgi:T5SS/PEP-CTERM-associated repeat protein
LPRRRSAVNKNLTFRAASLTIDGPVSDSGLIGILCRHQSRGGPLMACRSIRWQSAICTAIALTIQAGARFAVAAVSFSGDVIINTGGPSPPIQIGYQSFGSFRIDGGSVYSSGQMSIGQNQPGFGVATVTGNGSQWNITGPADVGISGMAQLNILDGAIVNIAQQGQMRVAASPFGHGTVVVRNPGSVLHVSSQLVLGSSGGTANMEIGDGAVVNAPTGSVQIGPRARLELDEGTLRISQLTQGGVISGAGEIISQSTTINNTGRIEAGAGDVLKITGVGTLQNQGVIFADGGTIEVQRSINNNSFGPNRAEITLRNGVVRIGTSDEGAAVPVQNSGLLAAIGGQNDFHGLVTNVQAGQIAVTNDSVLLFHDSVVANSGAITVFPGSKAIFLEDLELGATAVLQANVAGTEDDTGFGIIEVVDSLSLGSGELEVAVDGAYMPRVGDTFPLITAGGGISGSLSLAATRNLPDVLAWDLDIDASHVVLSVVPALAGDYNANGKVDAADYVIWRKVLDQTGPGLAADGDDNNLVNDADYNLWRANFGNTIDSSPAGAGAIPEPAAVCLAAIAAAAISLSRKRKLDYCSYRSRPL